MAVSTPSPWHTDAVGGRPPHHPSEPFSHSTVKSTAVDPKRSSGSVPGPALRCWNRPRMASEMMPQSGGAATRRVPPEVLPASAGFLEAFGLVTSSNRSSICVFLDAAAERMPCNLDHRPRAGEFDGSRPKRMSPAREVRARPLLRLLELGAMASSSALASEAVCLDAPRILAGRDRGDERQNHNDNPGHRCRLSVHENAGDLGKNSGTEPRPVGSPRGHGSHEHAHAGT